MNKSTTRGISAVLAVLLAPVLLHAGQNMAPADASKELKSFIEEPIDRPLLPPGTLTVGARFSEDLTDGYADILIPFWAPGNSLFFLNPKVGINDESQEQYSIGMGWRHLFPEQEVILGANAFYDYLNSRRGFDYHQAGFGAEVLTRWIDARFNYYLPEDDRNVFSSHRDVDRTGYGDSWAEDFSILQAVNYESRLFQRREAALEGFYAEAGFLTPWIDRWLELRWFGGYYHYDNQVGRDIDGFKARVEARVLPAILLDLEYYEDDELMGGHWTGGVRVSVPFEIGNIFQGKNPFEGICDAFRPRKREFKERMTEMVVRSPRIRTSEDEDFVEDKDSRREFSKTKTIANSVVFVDNQSAPGGTGTFEDPVNAIQDGVNTASANFGENGIVLVHGGGADYAGNVDITANSVALYGGACGFPVAGGAAFQFGPAAVVNGGFWAQNVPSFTIDGFVINNGHTVAGAAVRADNVLSTRVTCNEITTAATPRFGVYVLATGASDYSALVEENSITTSGTSAFGNLFQNTSAGTLTAAATGNTITTFGTGGHGSMFQNTAAGALTGTAAGNTITTSGIGAFGNYFQNLDGGTLNGTAAGNTISTSGVASHGDNFENIGVGTLIGTQDGDDIQTLGIAADGIRAQESVGTLTLNGTQNNTVSATGLAATKVNWVTGNEAGTMTVNGSPVTAPTDLP